MLQFCDSHDRRMARNNEKLDMTTIGTIWNSAMGSCDDRSQITVSPTLLLQLVHCNSGINNSAANVVAPVSRLSYPTRSGKMIRSSFLSIIQMKKMYCTEALIRSHEHHPEVCTSLILLCGPSIIDAPWSRLIFPEQPPLLMMLLLLFDQNQNTQVESKGNTEELSSVHLKWTTPSIQIWLDGWVKLLRISLRWSSGGFSNQIIPLNAIRNRNNSS